MNRTRTIVTISMLFAAAAGVQSFRTGWPGHVGASGSAGVGPPAFLVDRIRAGAQMNGDARPTRVLYVLTTRQAAAALDGGDRVDSDRPAYYAVLRGQFVARNAFIPRGASIPTGNQLTLTVDARSGAVTDLSVSNTSSLPDLGKLGQAHDITRVVGP